MANHDITNRTEQSSGPEGQGDKAGRSPPMRGGSSQGTGDRKPLKGPDRSTEPDKPIGRPPQPKPGEG